MLAQKSRPKKTQEKTKKNDLPKNPTQKKEDEKSYF